MKMLRLFSLLTVLLSSARWAGGAAPPPAFEIDHLTPQSQVDFNYVTGIATATHGVRIKFGEIELTADRMELNEATGWVQAQGSVALKRENQIWTGERLEYNFKTQQMKADAFKTGAAPFYVAGAGLAAEGTNKTYTATDTYITTDDAAQPNFRVRAKHLKIVPGESFTARDAVLYLGSVPVMWFPYYQRHLNRHPNNFAFTPGYRSLYGPYLLGTYNWYLSDRLNGGIHLDYREKRGWGGGPDLNFDLGDAGRGTVETYFVHDDKPGVTPQGGPIDPDRQRINFTWQTAFRTNLTAKIVVRQQSDAYVVRDFLENEYRKNVQPSSFAEISQLWPNFGLNVLAQPQINDIFETVERLPDVKLSALRQQLGVSPFYYESDTSASYLRYQFAKGAQPEYAAFRADSFHQLLLPRNFCGWLNVTPRVGGRLTHYGSVEGRDISEQNRWVFNTGAEVSTKAARTWPAARSQFWDVNGLRHILEPSVNYVFVPSPNRLPPQLPQFDQELHSFRLLPIDYPDYNAIDSIDSQNVLRLSLRNQVQTQRRQQLENLVNWAVYTDWRLKPRRGQGTFADLYSDLDFTPRTWLTFTSQTRYSLDNHYWREADHYATFQPHATWSYAIGHRYLRDEPALGRDYGNNLITSRLYYRLNENYAFRIAHRFEARDGTLEEQFYTLYRDLGSWTTALSFRVRDNRTGPTDYTVAVTFSLKAFPRFKLGADRESPSLLMGS